MQEDQLREFFPSLTESQYNDIRSLMIAITQGASTAIKVAQDEALLNNLTEREATARIINRLAEFYRFEVQGISQSYFDLYPQGSPGHEYINQILSDLNRQSINLQQAIDNGVHHAADLITRNNRSIILRSSASFVGEAVPYVAVVSEVIDGDFAGAGAELGGIVLGNVISSAVVLGLGLAGGPALWVGFAISTVAGYFITSGIGNNDEYENFVNNIVANFDPEVFQEITIANYELDNGEPATSSPSALLVFNLLRSISPTLTLDQAFQITERFSSLERKGPEGFLHALEKLFLDDDSAQPVINADQYFERLFDLQFSISQIQPFGRLELLSGDIYTQSLENSPRGQAVRYALQEANPFIYISGQEGFYESYLSPDGELNLENFTNDYLEQRSQYLAALIAYNQSNGSTTAFNPDINTFHRYIDKENTLGLPENRQGIIAFNDLTSNTLGVTSVANVLTLGIDLEDIPVTIFEGDLSGALSGNNANDSLFGGDDDDFIDGQRGDDYLEGGIGNDVLLGGQGSDTLIGGQGNDYLDSGVEDGVGNDDIQGGIGNDTLVSGGGTDLLSDEQGDDTFILEDNTESVIFDDEGNDSYVFTNFSGFVVVSDDNNNQHDGIYLNNASNIQLLAGEKFNDGGGENLWYDFNGQYRLEGTTLFITTDGATADTSDNGQIRIENFSNGDFGIVLEGHSEAPKNSGIIIDNNDGSQTLRARVLIPEGYLNNTSEPVYASFEITSNPQHVSPLTLDSITIYRLGESKSMEVHPDRQNIVAQEFLAMLIDSYGEETREYVSDFIDNSIDLDRRTIQVIVDDNDQDGIDKEPEIRVLANNDSGDVATNGSISTLNSDGSETIEAGRITIRRDDDKIVDFDVSGDSPFATLHYGTHFDTYDIGANFGSTFGRFIESGDQFSDQSLGGLFAAIGNRLGETSPLFTSAGSIREAVLDAFNDVSRFTGALNGSLLDALASGLPGVNLDNLDTDLENLLSGIASIGNGEFDFSTITDVIAERAADFYNNELPNRLTDKIFDELVGDGNLNAQETEVAKGLILHYVNQVLNTEVPGGINLAALTDEDRARLTAIMHPDLAALFNDQTTVVELISNYYTQEVPELISARINENIDGRYADEIKPLVEGYVSSVVAYSVNNRVDFSELNKQALFTTTSILQREIHNYVSNEVVVALGVTGAAAVIVRNTVGGYTNELSSLFTDGDINFTEANNNLRRQLPAVSSLLVGQAVSEFGLSGSSAEFVQTYGAQYVNEVLDYLSGGSNQLNFTTINQELLARGEDLLVEGATREATEALLGAVGLDEGEDGYDVAYSIVDGYVREVFSYVTDNNLDFNQVDLPDLNQLSNQLITGSIANAIARETGLSSDQAQALTNIAASYLGLGSINGAPGQVIPGGDILVNNLTDFGGGSSLVAQTQVDVGQQLQGQVATLLASELVSSLGIESGPLADFATSATSAVLNQVITNIATGADVLSGVGSIDFSEFAKDAVYQYIGRELGEEIYEPETKEGAIGAEIGAQIGYYFGGTIGTAIGSALGGYIGDLFGSKPPTPAAGADVVFDETTGQFYAANMWSQGSGQRQLAEDMANSVSDILNEIIGAIGGEILNPGTIHGGTYGHYGESLTYQPSGRYSTRTEFDSASAFLMMTEGVIRTVQSLDIAGGDVYAKRVIYRGIDELVAADNYTETSLQEILAPLTTALDYSFYQENKAEINALIALQPNSAFAAGWIITLEQARELRLGRRYHTDYEGGWQTLLDEESVLADSSLGIRRQRPNYADTDLRFENNDRIIDVQRADGSQALINDLVDGSTKTEINFTSQATLNAQLNNVHSSAVIHGNSASNVIAAGDLGNDVFGGGGHDHITGGNNADWLFGGTGNDTLDAVAAENNALFGDAGNDRLIGGAGSDWLEGGSGNDYLTAESGNDVLAGDSGSDLLHGGHGDDTYLFRRGDGQDRIYDDSGTDTISFGEGISIADVNIRKGGTNNQDLIIRFYDAQGNLTADMLTIQQWTSSQTRVERLRFSDGQIINIANIDRFFIGDNNDNVLIGTNGNDFIHGAGGDDVISSLGGDDIDIGGLGNDAVSGDSGNDLVVGANGNDNLHGGSGTDIVTGDLGNDAIYGGSGNDILSGGEGNDELDGGAGGDTYIFGVGDGQDTIRDSGASLGLVRITNVGTNLDSPSFINGYTFDDIWDEANQRLKHGYILQDGAIYRLVTANSNVQDSPSNDVLEFKQSVSLDTIRVQREGNDLLLATEEYANSRLNFSEIKDHIRLKDWFTSSGATLETIRIFGTDTINPQAISQWIGGRTSGERLNGSSSADWITSGAGRDTINAGAGNDIISAGADDDFIDGGAGGDTISGGDGSDTLSYASATSGIELNLTTGRGTVGDAAGDYVTNVENIVGSNYNDRLIGSSDRNILSGGRGNDTLIGGQGDDIYHFNRGDGSLTISEDGAAFGITGGGDDVIRFGPGINPGDLIISAEGEYGLRINLYNSSDTLLIENWLLDVSDRVEYFEFADGGSVQIEFRDFIGSERLFADWINGTNGADHILGLGADDVLTGRAGNDTLNGGEGNDSLFGGEGADHLIGGDGDDEVAYYDATSGVRVALDGSKSSTGSTAQGDTFDSIERVIGSRFNDEIIGNDSNNYLEALHGNDSVSGGVGADTLIGGYGNDTLSGGDDQDSLIGESGNDVLLGGRADDNLFGLHGDDQLFGGLNNDTLYGGVGDDQLHGGSDQDELHGDAGNDALYGEKGQDDLRGGDGNDRLYGGSSRDNLHGEQGNDTIAGEAGDDYLSGGLGNDSLSGGAGRDVIRGGSGDDVLDGGSRSDFLGGGEGNDTLYGGSRSDFLDGGEGNDRLEGGEGDDFYVFSGNFGSDVVVEAADRDSTDELIFSGYSIERLWFKEEGNDLIISVIGTDNQVRVVDYARFKVNSDLDYDVSDALNRVFATKAPISGLRTETDVLSIENLNSLIEIMAGFAEPDLVDDVPIEVRESSANLWQKEDLRALDERIEYAPVIINPEDGEHTLEEGASVSGRIQVTDRNPNESFSYHVINEPLYGELTLEDDGSYQYQAPTRFSGGDLDVIAVVAVEDSTDIRTETALRFNVIDGETDIAPITVNDISLFTSEGTEVVGDLQFVDPDTPLSEYTLSTDANLGTIVLDENGRFTYTPNASGIDSFTIRLSHTSGAVRTINTQITILEDSHIELDNTDVVFTIDENATDNLSSNERILIGQVQAAEASSEADSNISYGYSLTDNAEGRFDIDSATGDVYALGGANIDFEMIDGGVLPIEVRAFQLDNGVPNGKIIVKQFDIDVNNIFEATTIGDLELFTSEDTKTSADLEFMSPDTDLSEYTLSSDAALGSIVFDDEGRFTYTPHPDIAGIDNFTITLEHNHSNLVRTINVNMTILEDNQIDIDLSSASLGIDENSIDHLDYDENTLVGRVQAAEPGSTSGYRYSLTNDAFGRFTIDSATGNIYARGGFALDHESLNGGVLPIEVRAAQIVDGEPNGKFLIKEFNVAINDVDEIATDVRLRQTQVINPSTDYSQPIFVVDDVIDPDEPAAFNQYYYELPQNPSAIFSINRNTGAISVAKPELLKTNTNANGLYDLRIRLVKNSPDVNPNDPDEDDVYEESFTVDPSGYNRPTQFEGIQPGVEINEYSAYGSNTGSVNNDRVTHIRNLFSDADDSSLSYTLHSQTFTGSHVGSANGVYRLDSNGNIYVNNAARLSYERNSYHGQVKLSVSATDGKSPRVFSSVTINLKDVDENQVVLRYDNNRDEIPEVVSSPIYRAGGRYNQYLSYRENIGGNDEIARTHYERWYQGPGGRYYSGLTISNPSGRSDYIYDNSRRGTYPSGTYYYTQVADVEGFEDTRVYVNLAGQHYTLPRLLRDWDRITHPITFDLNDDGLGFTANIQFDINSDGELESTAWVDANDGLLVLDRNGNGFIDDGSELSFTADLAGAVTDLQGLQAFDSNGDGVLDANDARFGEFQIWQDSNQNGISEAGELLSLTEAGIASLDLTPQSLDDFYSDSDEDQAKRDKARSITNALVSQGASFTRTDGTTGVAGDVAFAHAEIEAGSVEGSTVQRGTEGDDLLRTSQSANYIRGGAGNDTILAGAGDDLIFGGNDNDIISGEEGDDRVYGEDGDDGLSGGSGVDYLDGGSGSDILDGGTGDDTLIGRSGNDTLSGGAGDDQLQGGLGRDRIIGGAGSNTVVFAAGDGIDILVAGTGEYHLSLQNFFADDIRFAQRDDQLLISFIDSDDQLIIEGFDPDGLFELSEDAIFNLQSIQFDDAFWDHSQLVTVIDQQLNPFINGTLGDDVIEGTIYSEEITTFSGNDEVNAGRGNDTVFAQSGNDRVDAGDGDDEIYGQEGADTLAGGDGDDEIYGGDDDDSLDGGAGNDVLYGQEGDDVLSDGAGDSQLFGGTGDDSLDGGEGEDTLSGGEGNDSIIAGAGDDLINAGAGNDTLEGTAGNNIINAGAGDDSVIGGVESDLILGDEGDDQVSAGQGDDLVYGDAGDDYLQGNEGNDLVSGGTGSDTLEGGLGDDTLSGGSGDDYYIHDGLGSDLFVEKEDAGSDTIITTSDYVLNSPYVENVWLQGNAISATGDNANNILTGNDRNNTLYGLDGDDVLIAGAGRNTLYGGQGDDRYVVDSEDNIIIEQDNEGTDTVVSSVNYVLDEGLENLEITGRGAWVATGNDLGNVITGNHWGNILVGEGGNDTIIGGNSRDTLIGGTGADRLIGGDENDTYYLDNINDEVIELADGGTGDHIVASFDYTLGETLERLSLSGDAVVGIGNHHDNSLYGSNGDNRLEGLDGDDQLRGGLGDDTLDGGAGDDYFHAGGGSNRLIGGTGNDIYDVLSSSDVIVEFANEGIETVYATADYTLSENIEYLNLKQGAAVGIGNAINNIIRAHLDDTDTTLSGLGGDDQLYGYRGDDILYGGEGNDTLSGYVGEDILYGGDGSDNLSGDFNNDHLLGGDGDDQLSGGHGDDLLEGGDGNDHLNAGSGTDRLIGGAGDDSYDVLDSSDTVVELANEGIDIVYTTVDYTLSQHVEHLTLKLGAILGTGNTLNNTIRADHDSDTTLSGLGGHDTLIGAGGNDVLIGGTGSDILAGGDGDDAYYIDTIGDRITEFVSEGTDTVYSSFNYALGNNLENLELLGAARVGTGNGLANTLVANDSGNILSGESGNDTLIGGAGRDILIGGSGVDRLIGGDENDTYYLDNINDEVVELADGGNDHIIASFDYTLGDTLERLTLEGSARVGLGNHHNNSLQGNNLHNRLEGFDGDDQLSGGLGNDTLDGGAGNDYFNAGGGINRLIGGVGNDIYDVFNTNDIIVEFANEGIETVYAAANYTLSDNLEYLTLKQGATQGTGNALNNTIRAHSVDTTLRGLGGNDHLMGSIGNDILYGGEGNDSLGGHNGDDVLYGGDGLDNLYGDDGHDRLFGNDGNDRLTGGLGDDTLDGGAGDDYFNAGAGTNRLIGGAGNDIYDVSSSTDTIVEFANEGIETVYSTANYTLSEHIEYLTLKQGATVGIGNASSNTIRAHNANTTLSGLGGNDNLVGSIGNDTLYGGEGNDTLGGSSGDDRLFGGEGSDNLNGGTGDDRLVGDGGDDLLTGGYGNDTLEGGAGNDYFNDNQGNNRLVGGAGNDVYDIYTTSDNTIIESADEGFDTVYSVVDHTLAANVEQLILKQGASSGTGNAIGNTIKAYRTDSTLSGLGGDDYLVGETGNDVLIGGTGNDTLEGRSGDDTYYVDSLGDVVLESNHNGTDKVYASVDHVLGNYIENLELTGAAITATGNVLDNRITGNAEANTLDGGSGNDTLVGGLGDDTYKVDSLGDQVVESSGQGHDAVHANINYQLGDNLEDLYLTGTATTGTGNHLDNLIYGNANANLLVGGEGADRLVGGEGNDNLDGGLGNDTLDGGTGLDILTGGTGDDVYYINHAGDTINEFANEGIDHVHSEVDYTLGTHLESLSLTGSAIEAKGNSLDNQINGNAFDNTLEGGQGSDTLDGGLGQDSLIGGEGSDVLIGGDGNDTLDGGTGLDTLSGGEGDDIYYINHTADTINESLNQGIDHVYAEADFTLAANLENLSLVASATIGTGNSLDNVIEGNTLDNTLEGGQGSDTLNGGLGRDTLNGGAGDDHLSGGEGNDTLTGGEGDDILDGGTGLDILSGGLGNDIYYINHAGDTINEAINEGIDHVHSEVDYTLGIALEHLSLVGSARVGSGNSLDNLIQGNALDNTLAGGQGSDTLDGGAGADVLTGGEGNDLLTGSEGNDILDGGTGLDTLSGGLGNDIYYINHPGDVINESLSQGIDHVYAEADFTLGANLENLSLISSATIGTGNSLDNVIEGNALGNTLAGGQGSDTIGGGAGHDSLAGGQGNDVLTGGDGKDTLDGGSGLDILSGGTGDDVYFINHAGDSINEDVNQGVDHVYSEVDYALGTNVENLSLQGSAISGIGNRQANLIEGNILDNTLDGGQGNDTLDGGTGHDNLIGGDGNDVLTGSEGNDTLDGGTGLDILSGGTGNDAYYINHAGDTINEEANEGVDYVYSEVDYTLGANLETLSLQGSATTGTGNSLDNVILGNALNNTLDGGQGNDTLHGGAGQDSLAGGEGNDGLLGDEGNDSLAGGEGDDALFGGEGNDTLDGGAGLDKLVGGGGDDIYYVNHAGDTIHESSNPGIDHVYAEVDYTLGANLENLSLVGSATIGTGNSLDNVIEGNALGNTLAGGQGSDTLDGASGHDNLTGGEGNDLLTGGDGNDTLDGGSGFDILSGGAGNDVYYISHSGDTINESVNQGVDHVYSEVDYILGDNLENLSLIGSAIEAKGNSLDNVIRGNALDNTLEGGQGNDTLDGGIVPSLDTLAGGAGDDVYYINHTGDTVIELAGEGVDHVYSTVDYLLGANLENLSIVGFAIEAQGNSLDNVIQGNTRDNTLDGGQGSDTLNGGLGHDSLTGGEGGDLLNGGVGNDTLDGGTGVDALSGGIGDDVYYIDHLDDSINELAGEGVDHVYSEVDYTLGIHLENLSLADNAIEARGNSFDNLIEGNALDNTLSGGAGNDTLSGGEGDDIYEFNIGDGSDHIIESATDSHAVDSIHFGVGITSYNLWFSRDGNDLVIYIDQTSDQLVIQDWYVQNTIERFILNNATTLSSAGVESLVQAMAVYTPAAGVVDIPQATKDAVRPIVSITWNNVISGDDRNNHLFGEGGDDTLFGGLGNDTLEGGFGNDVLDGGEGGDELVGAQGDDQYYIDDLADIAIEYANQGNDSVSTTLDSYVLHNNIENLYLAGAAITGTGNTSHNTLVGNDQDNFLVGLSGNDIIRGGLGNDHLEGGLGNDTLYGVEGQDALFGGTGDDVYYVRSESFVTELADQGNDTVYLVAGPSYTLNENVENLVLQGDANFGLGNTLDNIITGGDKNDNLAGLDGNDTLLGHSGFDLLQGGNGDDVLDGGLDADLLIGGEGSDTYLFDIGSDTDHIIESEIDIGSVDQVTFGAGITINDLWFTRTGNDLTINIHQTDDELVVDNWYEQSNTIEQFVTNTGEVLLSTNVEQLVQAMATFNPPDGEVNIPQSIRDDAQQVIVGAWS